MIYKYDRLDQYVFDEIHNSLVNNENCICIIDTPYDNKIFEIYRCALSVEQNILYNPSRIICNRADNKTEIIFDKLFIENIESKNREFRQVFYSIIEIISKNSGNNAYNKVIATYIYLIQNITYDFSEECYNAWGALINKRAVCQGISYAFSWILNEMSVPCGIIDGTAYTSGNRKISDHCWNIVEIDDKFYHVDVTWGLIQNNNGACFDYFMLTDSEISVDHQWNAYYIPLCNSMDYNYFVLNQSYATNIQNCRRIINEQMKKRRGLIYLKLSFDTNISSILDIFINSAKKHSIDVTGFFYYFNDKVKVLKILY